MKNSYLISAIVIVAVLLGVFLRSTKTEAPIIVSSESAKSISAVSDGSYELSISDSFISWEGEYLTSLSEKGTFKLSSGNLVVEGGLITSGEFTIDMNSIESIPYKDMLVNHLKSKDFFEVETYPTAKFVLKKMIPSSEEGAKIGRFVIAGDLTIKGITQPVSFIVTMTQDGKVLGATASFAINRADWEVKYNSPTFFKDLGDKIIRDAVSVGLDLKAVMVLQ